MKKVLLILVTQLLYTCQIFPQFTPDDSSLVKINYYRTADNELINSYLHSENENNIIASLLVLAQIKDSTFLDNIMNLNFNKFGNYISFTLGQYGRFDKTVKFLFDKLRSDSASFREDIFITLGRTGTEMDLDKLYQWIKDNPNDAEFFPLAVANFHISGIKINQEIISYLYSRVDLENDQNFIFNLIYSLFRIDAKLDNYGAITELLSRNVSDDIIFYSLGILRKNKIFPNNQGLILSLLNNNSWSIRNEAAKAVGFADFNEELFNEYLKLLFDRNGNVARSVAEAIKYLIFDNDSQKKKFQKDIENILDNHFLSKIIRDELTISYIHLFPNKFSNYKTVSANGNNFVYQSFLHSNNKSIKDIEFLSQRYFTENLLNKIHILEVLQEYKEFADRTDLQHNVILDALKSESSALIFYAAELSDSVFINQNKDILPEICLSQIKKLFNNPDFSESLFSLYTLTNKIDTATSFKIISKLKESSVYSISDKAHKTLGEITPSRMEDQYFDRFFSSAFEFSKAEVITNKGSFTIQFHTEIAPITVGSFIYSAKNNYFDNLIFHRVVPNFVIQTGDESGTGWEGAGYEITSEYSVKEYNKGAVGMASAGKDTEGSQWFVMQFNHPHLNYRYTNFATVISGSSVVDNIGQQDFIKAIRLIP